MTCSRCLTHDYCFHYDCPLACCPVAALASAAPAEGDANKALPRAGTQVSADTHTLAEPDFAESYSLELFGAAA